MRSFLWWVLRLTNLSLLFLIAGVGGVLLGSYSGIAKVVPKLNDAPAIQPGSGTRIVSADGVTLATLTTENRQYVSLDKIPTKLQEAVLATEDRDFYRHAGIDPKGIARAIYVDVRAGGAFRAGGSTITQQLARNLYLTQKRTISRKLAEMVLAVQIERAYTKPEILELYLNQIYFGEGAYGVQVAAKTYFRKDVSKLDTAECALLAGLIRSPERYSPFEDEQRSIDRRNMVLKLMTDEKYLTPDEAAEAKAEAPKLAPDHRPLGHARYLAPWFVTYVIKEFELQYGVGVLYQGNYTVQTTLNYEMQKAAEEAVQHGMERARRFRADQMALVSVDTRTGGIKAMVGGSDWSKNQYNIAAQGQGRQAGSSFKPFVYTAALLQGGTPDTKVNASSHSYPAGNGKKWTPHNFDGGSGGGTYTYRRALYVSNNVAAVAVANKIGITTVIDVAEKMGIPRGKMPPYLPTAIGAASVTPLEMASAFSIFATRGMRTEPYAIEKISDAFGRVVEEHRVVTWRVLDQSIATTMVDMMSDVIRHPGGTAHGIYRLLRGKFEAAGKTGTSSNYRDAWFVGYTNDLSTAVWMGNRNFKTTMRVGATGGTMAAPVWAEFMLKAQPIMVSARTSDHPVNVEEIRPPKPQREREQPQTTEPIPPDLLDPGDQPEADPTGADTDSQGRVEVNICPDSGLLAGPDCPAPNTVGYDLRAGDKLPTRHCDIHTGSRERAPERARPAARREGASGDKVTLSVCAITKQLATPYCPVVENATFDAAEAPTQSCTRHGRR